MNSTSRTAAIEAARKALAQQPVYLDTETTGLNPSDQVVELCVLDPAGSVLLESLVRPTTPVSPGAWRVHRISDSELRGAPSWAELWPKVREVVAGRRVAIFNADFDLRLMRQSHRAHGLAWNTQEMQSFCIMEMYARYNGVWSTRRGSYQWVSLQDAGRQCGIRLQNTHRARGDTLLARALLEYMARS